MVDHDGEGTVSPGIALLDALREARPVEISHAEREADKKEIAQLKARTEMLQRVAESHAEHIRTLRRQVQTLNNAVAELRRSGRPARAAAPAKRRGGLDDALERELYD